MVRATGATTSKGVVVRGVNRVFSSGQQRVVALRDVDLVIPEGSFTTLFGPSGCGKTTLLRILAGLQQPDSGEVSIFGQPPLEAAKAKNIGWIPQSSALLPWRTVRSNALLSKAVNKQADRHPHPGRVAQEVETILAEMGLSTFARSRPSTLSGGMRQRASLARGFVHGAPIMLMDEPFSALDELTREALRDKLVDMWRLLQKTIVFVTHSAFEAVLMSQQVVVMTPRPGQIHQVINVDLPYPRNSEIDMAPEFHAKVAQVKRALNEGWR
jgi:NitT/TauT family transport system ATP-binding protein